MERSRGAFGCACGRNADVDGARWAALCKVRGLMCVRVAVGVGGREVGRAGDTADTILLSVIIKTALVPCFQQRYSYTFEYTDNRVTSSQAKSSRPCLSPAPRPVLYLLRHRHNVCRAPQSSHQAIDALTHTNSGFLGSFRLGLS